MLTQPFIDFSSDIDFEWALSGRCHCSIPIAMENVGSSARPQVLIRSFGLAPGHNEREQYNK